MSDPLATQADPFGTGAPPDLEEPTPTADDLAQAGLEPEGDAPPAKAAEPQKADLSAFEARIQELEKRTHDSQAAFHNANMQAQRLAAENDQWRQAWARHAQQVESSRNLRLPEPEDPDTLLENGRNIYTLADQARMLAVQEARAMIDPLMQGFQAYSAEMQAIRPIAAGRLVEETEREWVGKGLSKKTFEKIRPQLLESIQDPNAYAAFMQKGAAMGLAAAQVLATQEGLELIDPQARKMPAKTPSAAPAGQGARGELTAEDRANIARVSRAFGIPADEVKADYEKSRGAR